MKFEQTEEKVQELQAISRALADQGVDSEATVAETDSESVLGYTQNSGRSYCNGAWPWLSC